jgi:hypothetical protein
MYWVIAALYLWAGVSCYASHLEELNRTSRYETGYKIIVFFFFLIGWPLSPFLRLIGSD